MKKTGWALVMVISLALLGAPQAFAQGQGKGQGKGGTQQQAQWVNNQPPGWSSQGQKQGWTKHGSDIPVGLQKNLETKGKGPKGLQKKQ